MISKKKKIFLSSLGMLASFAFVTPISSSISKQYTINNDVVNVSKKVDTKNPKSNLSIVNLGTEGLTEKEQTIVKSLYKSKPSNVSTDYSIGTDLQPIIASNSVYNIVKFDESKVHGVKDTDPTKRPSIINISNAEKALNFKDNNSNTTNPGDGIVVRPDTPLEFFEPIKDSDGKDKYIDQNFLDYYGILILRVEYTLKNTSSKGYEYLWISGFYSTLDKQFSSDNPTISGIEYSKSVSQVTNNDLINYPKFEGENKPTNRTLENRNNDSKTGSINYKVNFKYDFNDQIKIDEKKVSGFSVLNRYPTASSNQDNTITKSITSYSKEFLLKGFQPAPNISTEGIIIILSIIISSGVGMALIIYGSSIVIRKIRFRNSW